ncbi:telomerase-binding protein EST1A isoform X1 [Pristis pectinata]|uniref:telomerase-binding protein EST1A isoform X1 n=4 Tax=Pristis pectinata TaxID=685728 RepID=UPI00223DF3D5|nr:telomerase-binding protein EST1A isoform X1 [Pristis pectinata]
MAECLERVRVSEAELRELVRSLGPAAARADVPKVVKEPRARKDNRRPDIQIYQPGVSRLSTNKQRTTQLETSEREEVDHGGHKEGPSKSVPKRTSPLVGEGHGVGDSNQGCMNRNGQLDRNEEEDFKWTDEQTVPNSNFSAVGKQLKRVKKPDRQIYQPNRRVQGLSTDSPSGLGSEELVKKVEELRLADHSKAICPEEEVIGTGEEKGSQEDRGKIQLTVVAKAGKREKGRRGGREDSAGWANNCAEELADSQINRLQARAEKAGGPSKRYSRSDKRRGRNRTCSTSSAGSNNSLDGPHCQHRPADGERKKVAGKDRRTAGERKERLRPSKQVSISSTDSLEDDCAEENRNHMPERRKAFEKERAIGRTAEQPDCRNRENKPSPKVMFDSETVSRATVASKLNSEEKNKGRGKASRPVSKPGLSAGKFSQNTERRDKVEEPRGKGRGILVLPANTDLSSTAPGSPDSPQVGPRLLFGRGSRSRGRGGTSRRLWDPNNPDQKPALKSQTAQLHFLDTDDECSSSSQGETYSSYTHPTPTAYYKFQNSDNPYGYSRAAVTGPQYSYGAYPMPYQISGNSTIYSAQYYPGYPPPQFIAPYQAGQLNPEDMEQHVQTLQHQELGKLLRMADNQELQLSNLLSRDNVSKDGLERMAQLRAEILLLYERCILTDIEYSDNQNVEQTMWKNAFYQVIEKFRQMLKEPSGENGEEIRGKLLKLLDEGTSFFDSLLHKLQVTYQFKLEDYMDGMAIRSKPLRKVVKYALISAQRCLICQGDIARYREQANDTTNYGKARSWYLKAQQIAPKNGRPYNQLAILAIYTRRKLDAVYYYMRSLAASNPILTARESLMSLFEETKRKAEQAEFKRHKESDQSPGPRVKGKKQTFRQVGEDTSRVEVWIHTTHLHSSQGNESNKDDATSEQDEDLGNLSPSDLNKRFILNFLHAQGKLFTKIGMETFPSVAANVLKEFRVLLQHSPSPIGNTRMLQLMAINMFAVHHSQLKDSGSENCRSVIQEHATALGLAMFGLLVERCIEQLKEAARARSSEEEEEDDIKVSAFSLDLKELLPSVKVWSDWMLGHPDEWNPPPNSLILPKEIAIDVWAMLAEFCNIFTAVNQSEVPLYKDPDEDLTLLVLDEDKILSGFVPLLAAPQDPCYVETAADKVIAADCKRVTVLKYFLEALCGQEEPLLAFKGGKYVSMAPIPDSLGKEDGGQQGKQLEDQEEDVIIEEYEGQDTEPEGSGGEDDIKELRAKKQALTKKFAEQQRRQEKIQALLEDQTFKRQIEIEITPVFLVPDTNGFIDHLPGLVKLLDSRLYIIVVPLIVINELDGLAKGQDTDYHGANHAKLVQERAKKAIDFLEQKFESRDSCLRALTSRGNELESIAFRSEDTTGQQGNNDDLILSCCLHYCKDKAKDFMPAHKDEPIRLRRDVVLLTDDRNMRVKALTRNVPVRAIPVFLKWAKVG